MSMSAMTRSESAGDGKPAVLPHPDVWRATQTLAPGFSQGVETGMAALSAQLPGGGWPRGGLVEILQPTPGTGEWQLLQAALLQGERPVALLQPPYAPHAAAWVQAGGAPERLLWVQPQHEADALWAAEQMLRSQTLDALVFWLGESAYRQLHRLHLAAQHSHGLCFLLRPLRCASQASPAMLRLALTPDGTQGGSQLRILKRRGGPLHTVLHLDAERMTQEAAIS